MFNYNFVDKYKNFRVKVMKDDKKNLFYVLDNKKRMYFSRSLDSTKKVQDYYKGICVEQDKDSPHCYLSDNFDVNYSDVVVDIGAAEGNFSLKVIDKVSKIYIFEYDDLWIEALKATFEPYKNKVHIVKKYVSNTNDKKSISLDKFFQKKQKNIDFVKMDIEGEETNALRGMDNLLKNNIQMKLSVCAYHNQLDEANIMHIFRNIEKSTGVKYNVDAKGYILFLYGKKLTPPYLRRGVLQVQRN